MNLRLLWNCLKGKKFNMVEDRASKRDGSIFLFMNGRGAVPILRGAAHEQRAAERNGHKPHWRDESLANLFKKLREEVDEMEAAFLNEPNERKLEEYGDVKWTATMIADHDYLLGEWEEKPPWTLPE